MLALMEMTNPMWEWLIAPIALVSIGFLIGHFVGQWEKDKDDEVWERPHADPDHIKILGYINPPPYNWELEIKNKEERSNKDD